MRVISNLSEMEKMLIQFIRKSSTEQIDELIKKIDDEACLQILKDIKSEKIEWH